MWFIFEIVITLFFLIRNLIQYDGEFNLFINLIPWYQRLHICEFSKVSSEKETLIKDSQVSTSPEKETGLE